MKKLRLAFLLPAFVAVTPAIAAPHASQPRPAFAVPRASATDRPQRAAPLRYVTLDRMIRGFAEQAHASRATSNAVVLAQR